MRDITDVDDPVDGSGQRYRAVIIFWQGYCFLLWSFSFCTLIISRLFIISLHQHNNKFLRFYLYLLIIIEIHDCLIISLLYTWQFFCSLRSTPIPPLHLLLSRFILRKIAIWVCRICTLPMISSTPRSTWQFFSNNYRNLRLSYNFSIVPVCFVYC